MKNVLAIACLVLLVAFGLWFVLGDTDGDAPPAVPLDTSDSNGFVPEDQLGAGVELAGTGEFTDDGQRRYPPGKDPFKPRVVRTGSMQVLPIGPDEKVLDADEITVRLYSFYERATVHCTKRDRETGLWTFEEVPIGKVRINVFGDMIAEHEELALVREGVDGYKKVHVMRGGSIHYRVLTVDDTVPPKVTLTLIDLKSGNPVAVRYQVRVPGSITAAHRATEFTQGGEGDIFAIPPGKYRLRVSVESGESDQVDVTLAPGDAESVSLALRR